MRVRDIPLPAGRRRWSGWLSGRSGGLPRRLGPLALAAAAVAACLLQAPANAEVAEVAAVPGLHMIEGQSSFDNGTLKFATVQCPAGQVLVGTGARTEGFFGDPSDNQLMLSGAVPIGNNAAIAQASADETGFAGAWSMSIYGMCANPVPGLQIVNTSTLSDSTGVKVKSASCPAGTRLVGGTGAALGGFGSESQLRLEAVQLSDFSVLVVGAEDETGFSGNWRVDAYAFCANALPGQHLVTNRTASNATDAKKLLVTQCSAGEVLLGTGGAITYVGTTHGQVGLRSLVPTPVGSSTPTGVFGVANADETGFAGSWSLSAQAMCAAA
jgi:hypothetical protein